MKICMVGLGVGKANGAFVGGHVNNIVNLSRKLIENGHQVHLVTTPPIHSNSYPLRLCEIPVTPIKVRGDYFNVNARYGLEFVTKAILKIRKLHREQRFDIIHSHSASPLIALVPEVRGIFSHVSTMHTLYCPLGESWINHRVSRYCLGKLDIISVLSENTKKSLGGVISEGKIRIIPPLINTSLYAPCLSRRLAPGISERGSPTILFLGNLSKTKGLDILIEALGMVKGGFPDAKLLVGLDMPLEKFLTQDFGIKQQIKSLGLEQSVVPLGIIKDLPQVMTQSDIFVAPFRSTHGPADYPLSILEAMASGLPVVATNIGGIPEIVRDGENGLLVEPSDSMGLAESISYLLKNREEAIRMGKNGNNFVLELSQDVVQKLESAYLEIVK